QLLPGRRALAVYRHQAGAMKTRDRATSKPMSRLRLRILNRRANAWILAHPLEFALTALKGFRANQGLLLAGAVAYYALLSIVPFLMLVVVVLSHFIDQADLLRTMHRYLELLVPGQSKPIIDEVAHFLESRDLITWVLGATMLFFSSLAFTVL